MNKVLLLKEKWLLLTQHFSDGLKSVSILETNNFWQDIHNIYCSTGEEIGEGDDDDDKKSGIVNYINDSGDSNFHFDAYRIEKDTDFLEFLKKLKDKT